MHAGRSLRGHRNDQGWRYQRDTAAYAALYSSGREGVWPPEGSRRVDAAFLQQQLEAAQRYRDLA